MVVKNSIIIFAALLAGGLLNFGAISIFSRLLDPAEYGTFALAMAASALAVAFLYQWVMHSFTRFLPQRSECKSQEYLRSFVGILVFISVAFIALSLTAFGIGQHFNIGPTSLSLWIWVLVPAIAIIETFFNAVSQYVRLVHERVGLFAAATVIRSIIYILLGFFLVNAGWSFYGLISAAVISFFVPTLFLALSNKDWRTISLKSLSRPAIQEIMGFGFPIIAVTTLQAAIASTDNFMLTWLIGPEATGHYAVTLDLVTKSIIFLMLVVNRTTYPLVVKKLEYEGYEAAQYQYKHNTVLLMTLSVPACAGIAILSQNIVDILLGAEFREEAGQIIPFLTLVSFLNCAFQFYLTPAFHLAKKTQLMILPVLLAFAVNIVVSYNAIPRLGLNGAIVGSLCAYLTCFMASFYAVRKAFPVPFPGRDFLKIILATIVMSATIWTFRSHGSPLALLSGISIGAIVYFMVIGVLDVGGYASFLKRKLATRA